jgi:hypothetical protein
MGFFTWASETNYPAGSNAWSGQPLSVQPVGDYFLPGVKLPAESLNYVLQQIGYNLNGSVSSLTALRALAVPAGNVLVQITPENGNIMGGISTAYFGGVYYWDAAYNVLDNGATAIRPIAITAGNPGRWRLAAGPLTTCTDYYTDLNSLSSSVNVTGASGGLATFSTGFPFVLTAGSDPTATVPSDVYLGDTIDFEVCAATSVVTGSGALNWGITFYKTTSSNYISASFGKVYTTSVSAVGSSECVVAKMRYTVLPADITLGTLTIGLVFSAGGTSVNMNSTIQYLRYTIRRP